MRWESKFATAGHKGQIFAAQVFMNMITTRTWFCSAYITNTNLSYANFFKKSYWKKCELWEKPLDGYSGAGRNVQWIRPLWRRVFHPSTGEQQTLRTVI
uniref:Pentapeptide repeat protein QnrB family n=1 Tax=Klebsiella pneumoniae TaxID=573 RepID=A0A8B0SS18_KLEPN|nr:Pentapeptide repeat protein QnrB family [Klebsiella pneumoniae]